MPSSKKKQSSGTKPGKKRSGGLHSEETLAGGSKAHPRAGLPAKESIVSEKTFRSPKGRIYRILITKEMDAYDKPKRPAAKRSQKK